MAPPLFIVNVSFVSICEKHYLDGSHGSPGPWLQEGMRRLTGGYVIKAAASKFK